MSNAAPASLTPEVMDAIGAYARAAEDEYAAIILHNVAANASAEYDRDHRNAIDDGDDTDAYEYSRRALRAAELAGEIRAAKTAEERQARIRLSELAGTGEVTEDAIRNRYDLAQFGFQRAARVVLAALADA